MPRVSDRRRKPRRRAIAETETTWVKLEGLPGTPNEVLAKIVDASEVAIGVELSVALEENTYVIVNGHAGGPTSDGKIRARVVRCIALPGGGFSAGLIYEEGSESDRPTGYSEPIVDYYEVLQISPNAHVETIHRVYRLLAQHFHPDNKDTGDWKIK